MSIENKHTTRSLAATLAIAIFALSVILLLLFSVLQLFWQRVFQGIIAQGIWTLLAILGMAFLAGLVGLYAARRLTRPLTKLTDIATEVSNGNLDVEASTEGPDEFTHLASAFNSMTAQVRELISNLEIRVEERTSELEESTSQAKKRAAQFEAITQISQEISLSQELETLLPKITKVISQQFGFYHVGIFLIDENKEYAVLQAANSSGGQKMLAREHRLRVGETGLVGFATFSGKARIALDTGFDATYFDNPDLPDTRSEIALPMIVGGKIIGALDVQSVVPNAFSQEDIDTLSALAAQVAVAIQNARLFEETSNALAKAQTLSQQITATGWSQFIQQTQLAGIQRRKSKSTLLRETPIEDMPNDNINDTLRLPIMLRGQRVGELKLKASDKRQWSQDEIDIASAIIERAAIAMENARLVTDAQRLAARELVIGEIASSVSATTDIEEIMRSAVQELGRKMGGAEVVLELGIEENLKGETLTD